MARCFRTHLLSCCHFPLRFLGTKDTEEGRIKLMYVWILELISFPCCKPLHVMFSARNVSPYLKYMHSKSNLTSSYLLRGLPDPLIQPLFACIWQALLLYLLSPLLNYKLHENRSHVCFV